MKTASKSPALLRTLAPYGVPERRVHMLGGEVTADDLGFLDLFKLPVDAPEGTKAIRPDAVVETDTGAVLYVVDEKRMFAGKGSEEAQLKYLRETLASRGSNGHLALLRPGELVVMPITLQKSAPTSVTIEGDSPIAGSFFAAFSNGLLLGEKSTRATADYVFEAMFKLVWSVADRLAKLRIRRTDVLSLVGRALFFRFLKDRDIVRDTDVAVVLPRANSILEAFDTAANADATCRWLDQTFNGDLLPLSGSGETYFTELGKRTGNRLFFHLRAIIEGTEPVGDEGYQLPLALDFGAFDFAHVPVGLLSQVYERFAWEWERETAKSTSVHYTPRHLAQLMVNEAFDGLQNAEHVRVLDPACGASVFLVLAFRRLYQERWKATGKRPQTREIRQILETQLVGFDINESAIRLASLSLYLTAIELDPNPVPPEKLHFKPLRNKVLFNFRREDEMDSKGAVAGSLGETVPASFNGVFDLVLGNPPWTSLDKKETALANVFNHLSKRIIEARPAPGAPKLSRDYINPDRTPDLPFLWRSTEWCKPGGRIALALPASILLKQEDIPSQARQTLFRLVEVNGIINGTNLSDTKVWEKMNQPFMLLFATNRVPKEDHRLRLITPHLDRRLNNRGLFRIDAKSTLWISPAETFAQPWKWKALSVGTSLDVEVTEKILAKKLPSVLDYWEEQLGLVSGRGYDVDGTPQKSAAFLLGKPNLIKAEDGEFVVPTNALDPFKRETLYFPKTEAIYKAPLFLLKEASPSKREYGYALVSAKSVAYNRSYYGYSAHGHPEGSKLVGFLSLLSHTSLWNHYSLITSSKLGAERRTVLKSTFDDFPIVPYETLTSKQKASVQDLSERLFSGDLSVFPEIDALFAELYGLDESDLAVIRDTVETAMPYQSSRERACNPPKVVEVRAFTTALRNALQPFFAVAGEELKVDAIEPVEGTFIFKAAFRFFMLYRTENAPALPPRGLDEAIIALANQGDVSRIIHHLPNGLLVGLFNQYRYWTPSRTRLLAAEIAREHLTVFDD